MEKMLSVLNRIAQNTREAPIDQFKRVLLLYEEKIVYLGDCCIRFDKFKYFKAFLKNAAIDINFSLRQNQKYYEGLLTNNPHVDNIGMLDWENIDFQKYDAIFCISYREDIFLKFLDNRFDKLILNETFKLAIFSLSELMLKPKLEAKYIFPQKEELVENLKVFSVGELFISEPEQYWAQRWLLNNGFKEDEKLIVIFDSTSNREKLLSISVYFDLLNFLLNRQNVKILLFDESKMGKENFYKGWLDSKAFDKLIFSKGLTLREDLCLIGSKRPMMILGPCTGLMHCASSIYNHYLNDGMNLNDIPVMMAYTGQYAPEHKNANFWWANSPLIDCLMLKKTNGRKEIVVLSQVAEKEKDSVNALACSEYTAPLLANYIENRLKVAGSK